MGAFRAGAWRYLSTDLGRKDIPPPPPPSLRAALDMQEKTLINDIEVVAMLRRTRELHILRKIPS